MSEWTVRRRCNTCGKMRDDSDPCSECSAKQAAVATAKEAVVEAAVAYIDAAKVYQSSDHDMSLLDAVHRTDEALEHAVDRLREVRDAG